jgi:hypothetical protein
MGVSMLNLKATVVSATFLAGATATASLDQEVLITNCTSDIVAYKFEKRLFRETRISHLFSVVGDEWADWCGEQGQWETVDGKTVTCERMVQTDVTLKRTRVNGRTFTKIAFQRKLDDRYFPPGGIEALAVIGEEDAQFIRHDQKTIDFSQGMITKKTVQFLAPRGVGYTSANDALASAYYRTKQIKKTISYHKKECTLRKTAPTKLS